MTTPFPFQAGSVLPAQSLNDITNLPINNQTASYTLVVGDAGKRVVMNVATANTVTVNDSVFTTGDTIFVANKGAGASTLTAGAGVTINSASGLVLVQHQSGQLVALSASSFLFVASDVTAAAGGLVVVKAETAFSAVSNVTADGVFTSAHTNYRIIMRFAMDSGSLRLQFRAATVDTATGYNFQRLSANLTTASAVRSSSQTSAEIGFNTGAAFDGSVALEIYGPQVASPTIFMALHANVDGAYTTPILLQYSSNQSASTAFDGIKIAGSNANIAGSFTIYGYAKTV